MPEFDPSQFTTVVTDALKSFRQDSSYAVSMMRQAMNIHHKRETWQLRLDLRIAEKEAREQCVKENFKCVLKTPCGTGDCLYAKNEFQMICGVVFKAGKSDKPQGGQSCDSDAAVESLRKIRHQQV